MRSEITLVYISIIQQPRAVEQAGEGSLSSPRQPGPAWGPSSRAFPPQPLHHSNAKLPCLCPENILFYFSLLFDLLSYFSFLVLCPCGTSSDPTKPSFDATSFSAPVGPFHTYSFSSPFSYNTIIFCLQVSLLYRLQLGEQSP